MSATTDKYNAARASNPNAKLSEFITSTPSSPVTGSAPTGPAPFTGNVVTRDRVKEDKFMAKLGINSGQLAMLDPRQLLEGTYSQQELAGMKDYQDILARDKAKNDLMATTKPTNSVMGVLENALRMKSDPAKQGIGPAGSYGAAGISTTGVSGYTTLLASLKQRAQENNGRYDSFVNQLRQTGGEMANVYNIAADRYKVLNDDYQKQVDRLDKLTSNLMQHEQALDLLNRRAEIDKEMYKYQADTLSGKGPSASESLTGLEKGYVWLNGEWKDAGSAEVVFGSVGNPKDAQFDQCGYFSNRATTGGDHVGDLYGSIGVKGTKMGAVDPTILTPSVGNTLMLPIGDPKNGHTAVVLGYNDQTGDISVVERNKNRDGKTTFGTYNLNELNSEYQLGVNFGFSPSRLSPEIEGAIANTSNAETESRISGLIPAHPMYQGRGTSNQEAKAIEKDIRRGIQAGKSDAEIIVGYMSEKGKPWADVAMNLFGLSSGVTSPNYNSKKAISLPINEGKPVQAMLNVENALTSQVDKDYSDSLVATEVVSRAKEARTLLASMPGAEGKFDSKLNQWYVQTPKGATSEDQQKAVKAQAILTDITRGFFTRTIGKAMTENEMKLLEPLITSMKDQPDTIQTKLQQMEESVLNTHNAVRRQVGLPPVNELQLLNPEIRLQLYRGGLDEKESAATPQVSQSSQDILNEFGIK